jgi:hypothetical protein
LLLGGGGGSVWERITVREINNTKLLIKTITEMPPPKTLEVFGVHLTDHCNLKCAGCSHFSPLVKETFADFDKMEKDFKRLSYLTESKVKQIVLQGGEPLLHKDCSAFMKMARFYFKKTHIYLLTNGILLARQSEDFWNICKTYKIDIAISLYPINIEIGRIENKCREYNIDLFYAGKKDEAMFRIPINLLGNCDGKIILKNAYWDSVAAFYVTANYSLVRLLHIYIIFLFFLIKIYMSLTGILLISIKRTI